MREDIIEIIRTMSVGDLIRSMAFLNDILDLSEESDPSIKESVLIHSIALTLKLSNRIKCMSDSDVASEIDRHIQISRNSDKINFLSIEVGLN